MKQPNLTYIISTFNKFEYLRIIMNELLDNVKKDEEVIVVDGGSSDETYTFLSNLHRQGLIQEFLSEKDQGESHGFNKAILLANGKLIKFLTDDDVFNYDAIDMCKKYMLENNSLDFMFTGGADYHYLKNNDIHYFTNMYEEWLNEYSVNGKSFSFCMLGAMMNKASLPILGLLNPSIKRADAEYSLRITSSKIKIGLYSAPCFVRILNDKSNSSVFDEKIKIETEKLNSFYDFDLDGPPQKEYLSFETIIKNLLRPLYRLIFPLPNIPNLQSSNPTLDRPLLSYKEAYERAKEWMYNEYSKSEKAVISNL